MTQSASSVAVENMFSTSVIIVNGNRSTLAPHRLNWLIFIHDNYPLYFDMGPSDNSDPGIAASHSRAKQNYPSNARQNVDDRETELLNAV